MVFESELANTLLVALTTGGIVSGLAALASDGKWAWKKFLHSLGLATIAGLAVIQTQFDGAVSAQNAVPVFLAIIGGSFIGNKLNTIGSKLKGIVKK